MNGDCQTTSAYLVQSELVQLRSIHRELSRWHVIGVVLKRASPTRSIGFIVATSISLIIVPTLLFIMIFGAPAPTLVPVAFAVTLATICLTFEWCVVSAFDETTGLTGSCKLRPELRLRSIRYVLFKELADEKWCKRANRLNVLHNIAHEELNLDQSALDRHPVYLILFTVFVVLLGGGSGQSAMWTSGVGITLMLITGMLLSLWWFIRKPIAALVMTKGYRDREFCLFLNMLRVDLDTE